MDHKQKYPMTPTQIATLITEDVNTPSLTQVIYRAILQTLLLSEAISGEDIKVAIQTGLSASKEHRTTLDDPQIIAAIVRAVQHYGVNEEELKIALLEALNLIFGPGGKLSNQVRLISRTKTPDGRQQKPTSEDAKNLFQAVLQSLQEVPRR